ncbi:MAG: ATP-grasp domain-containing protein [Ignavibacteria bacterium]|nr:ATP-grasp domain-containing protein [Ignavibacteria bacterium]
MSKKRKITIAATGLNNTDNPGPGIPFIRGVLDSDFFDAKIIGLAYENLEPGIYMHDLIKKSYHIPYPTAGSDVLIKRLEYINSIEDIDVLIPNFDAELYTFMKSSNKLEEMGIKTFLPTIEQYEERHKSNLPKFGEKYGVKVPASKAVYFERELITVEKEIKYPFYVKGKFYEAELAYNREQAITFLRKISAKWGFPIIIQQYVSGTEVNVVALGDGKGNTVGAVPMRKLYITDKGKAWAGITLADDNLLKLTKRLIKKTKWRGGMELEIIRSKNNEYFLVEINPRLPAWVYLSVGAGQNLPEALVKLALGIEVEPFTEYEVGKIFIRYSFDLITNIEEFEKLSLYAEL